MGSQGRRQLVEVDYVEANAPALMVDMIFLVAFL